MLRIESVRRLTFWASFFKKYINYFKFCAFLKLYTGFLHILTNGFPGLFHDFSMTLNQISMTKLKSRYKHENCRKCCVLFWASFFKKHINYFKLGVNEHVILTNFHDLSKTFMIWGFSMTFPGLEMTILKFHDRSRFSMYVRTLFKVLKCCTTRGCVLLPLLRT